MGRLHSVLPRTKYIPHSHFQVMTSLCDVCYGVMYVDCNTSLAKGSRVFSLYAIVWDIDILIRNSKG